jgi:hypothetical protein
MTLFNSCVKNKSKLVGYTLPLVTVLFFSICSSIYSQSNSSAKKKFEIIDQEQKELEKAKTLKVKSRIKNVAFYDKQGMLPANLVISEKVIFDKRGYRKSLTRYRSLGLVDFKYTYNYDSKGHLAEAATFDSKNAMVTKRISKFNKIGNETERRIIDYSHNTVNKAIFSYDEAGNLTTTKNYSEKGDLLSEIIFTYKDGLILNSLTKDAKGGTSMDVTNSYDSDSRIIQEDHKGKEGTYVITYKYDARSNQIEINTPNYKRNYEYDENNNLIEDKMYLPTGARQFRVQFNYYPNGLQKEEIRFNTDDKPAFNGTYIYEFYK